MVSGGQVSRVVIPLPDGERLAATLYLPAAAEAGPVPCLLEALPYRKDDLTAGYRPEYLRFRDEFGYAVARVDLRGTGSSTGVMLDEYHEQEQADLAVVVGWLAGQPWCTGAIGMFGTSWSGFNALQLAAQAPPALKAVVASYASDDRWSDDVHYQGGALRLLDLVDYPLYMVAMNALPPVPDVFGAGWAQEWRRRVEETPAWLFTWLRQQSDGPYWRHGSLRPDPGRVACPVMLVTGWADGYHNVAYRLPRALQENGTPVRVLAGPWSHAAPSTSVPGPNLDHVPLMARWWDRWLRDAPVDDENEPPLQVFVRSYTDPSPTAAQWAGRWESHDAASLKSVVDVELPFADAVLAGAELRDGVAFYEPALDIGVTAWNQCAAGLPWGQPQDQTPDDARSLLLSWPGAPSGTVLGHPRVRLRVRMDAEIAFVSAKLELTPPSGRPSLLVDRGLLNLAYRDDDPAHPRPARPGEWADVEIELDATAFELTPAHTLRLALANADWPNTVAPPGTWSAVDLAASRLILPVSAGSPFPEPDLPQPVVDFGALDDDDLDDDSWVTWRHGRDVLAGTLWAEVEHGSAYSGPGPHSCGEHYTGRVELDPATGDQRLRASCRYDVTWPGVEAVSQAELDVLVEPDCFDVHLELEVRDGGERLARRTWHERIPRLWT